MLPAVDITFEFHSDTPAGKDPDEFSATLRRYHQLLWTKRLPCGELFSLAAEPQSYLVHRSRLGVFHLTSDAITTRLLGRAWRVVNEIPPEELPEDLGYTIGSAILFPGNRVVWIRLRGEPVAVPAGSKGSAHTRCNNRAVAHAACGRGDARPRGPSAPGSARQRAGSTAAVAPSSRKRSWPGCSTELLARRRACGDAQARV